VLLKRGRHAGHLLFWTLSPDDLWVAQEEAEVYQVEMEPPEGSATAQATCGMRCFGPQTNSIFRPLRFCILH